MEWAVGQWVEVIDGMAGYLRVGHVQQIEKITDIGTIKLFGNGNCWDASRFKPFVWQVGKTYRTTLEGVTATIKERESGRLLGKRSDMLPGPWSWDDTTGLMRCCEKDATVPHLLPVLADEPSEHEPTLTERFRVEQYGNRWLVRDNQTGLIARFTTHGNATGAVEMMKNGDMTWSWSEDDEDDVDDVQEPPLPSRYHRRIKGVVIDLYDIAEAYGLQGHAEFHAVKKILMAGNRGYKSREQDLAEAEQSIQRARELAKGGE